MVLKGIKTYSVNKGGSQMTAERTMLLALFIGFFASLTISTTTHAGTLCDCDLQWDGIIDAHDFALFHTLG